MKVSMKVSGFYSGYLLFRLKFLNKEKPHLKQKCQKGLELFIITDASSTLIFYMRHSRRWGKKTTKQRLCPWHIRAFPSTSLVYLLRLTWNQVQQTHKHRTNTCYLTEWGYIIQANTFQEENSKNAWSVVHCLLNLQGQRRNLGFLWWCHFVPSWPSLGILLVFSWHVIRPEVFFFVWCPRTIFWLV